MTHCCSTFSAGISVPWRTSPSAHGEPVHQYQRNKHYLSAQQSGRRLQRTGQLWVVPRALQQVSLILNKTFFVFCAQAHRSWSITGRTFTSKCEAGFLIIWTTKPSICSFYRVRITVEASSPDVLKEATVALKKEIGGNLFAESVFV